MEYAYPFLLSVLVLLWMGGFTDGFIGHPMVICLITCGEMNGLPKNFDRVDGKGGQRQSFSNRWCVVAH